MEKVHLDKKAALTIALSLLNGEKTNKDYGSAALKESKLILKNILETLEVEAEMMAKSSVKPKKPNKKRALTPAQRMNVRAANNLMADWKNMTILELEEGKDESK